MSVRKEIAKWAGEKFIVPSRPLAIVPSYEEYLLWLATYRKPPSYEDVYAYLTSQVRPVVWPSIVEYQSGGKPHEIARDVFEWLKAKVEGK